MTFLPQHSQDEFAVTRSWLEAVSRADIQEGLEKVYALVARETAQRKPLCQASGRCCNFTKWGHYLYVTGIEVAYTLVKFREKPEAFDVRPPRPLPVGGAIERTRTVSLAQVDDARAQGDCPFLIGTLCGVHTIKPLGCRVYFCDETAQEWQRDLSERALGMIRELHDSHNIEYRYGEWRAMLDRVVAAAE
ncbi:MAG: hypothetical protein U0640_09540 [Phycisphaerales bacterium]